jgi:peptidoglycan/LPS O-acetylase OafA/YrhL
MSKGLSLYLDLLRFALAMVVWMGHSTYAGYTGHPFVLWFMFPYMQTAVIGFFVLSGFVVAHVTTINQNNPTAYTIARISRLYSMVIPALILTFLCDAIGQSIDSKFYHVGPVALGDDQLFQYVASFFMVNNFSAVASGPAGTNGPFWSLSYELTYYIAFGLYLTKNRTSLIVGSILLFAVAGLGILALFPIWLLGVLGYHLQKRWTIPVVLAVVLFPLSAFLLAKTGWSRYELDYSLGRPYLIDYADALLVAINIYAASSLARSLAAALGWCESLVRWLGSLTFAIYLCHRPLLQFLTVIQIDKPGTAAEQLWLFGGSFVVISIISILADHARRNLRKILELAALSLSVTSAASPMHEVVNRR